MERMFERPAVYLIEHTATGRVYVGSTSNLSKRWSRHRQELRDGKHRNRHLQAAWDLYGGDAFRWRVLAVIEPSQRIWLEQRAIDALDACNPEHGFNKAREAGVSYGARGRVWTEEQRAAASAYWKHRRPAGWRPPGLAEADGLPDDSPGLRCRKGHVKDGTYTRTRTNGSVQVRCQVCAREDARDRQRRKLGIPADHPPGKHFNRRASGARG